MIHLLGGQKRRAARNGATLLFKPGLWEQLTGGSSVSYRNLFLRNYTTIRHICRGFGRLGVAVVAIDTKRRTVAGSVCLAARVGEPSVAIVGRHGLTDLYLDADSALSLRHLAVIVHPVSSWEPHRLRLSLLDLRTGQRFVSEHGKTLEGLVAEGPVFVQCGRYALMCLVTGEEADWPESGSDAWAMIPEREYLEAHVADQEQSPRQHMWGPRPRPEQPLRKTHITLVDGPEMAQALLLGAGEPVAGYLTARSNNMSRTVPVGFRALRQGVLIGRNDRCNQHELLSDLRISRVHMMLRWIDQRLYAVDLASTGRMYVVQRGALRPIRLAPLNGPGELILGRGRAWIAWQPEVHLPQLARRRHDS